MLITQVLGDFERYQWWILFLILMNKFGVAFHTMAIIFMAPPTTFTCPNNATCCDNPVYDTSIFKKTIIMEWHLICGKTWLKDFTQTIYQFGVFIGGVLFGVVSDRYGRRPALIISVLIEVFAGVIASFLPDYWSFTIVRMILGSAVGGIMVVGFVLLMEFVGNNKRNVISAVFHLPFTFGLVLLALYGYLLRDYVYFHLAISLSNSLLVFYIYLLPESPRWLLAMNRTSDAVQLITRAAKFNKMSTSEIEINVKKYQIKHGGNSMKKGNIFDLFRTPNMRKNMLVISFQWFAVSYCFYGMAQYISQMSGGIFVNVIANGIVTCCSCVASIPVMKYVNRKTTLVVGNLSCSFCLFIIAVCSEGKILVVIACVGVFFGFVVFIVIYLYCTEMFPTVVRTAAMGISSMMARVGAMFAPFVLGLKPYGGWCAPLALGLVPMIASVMCLLLPETRGCELLMTLEEGEAFTGKPLTRQAHDNEKEMTNAENALDLEKRNSKVQVSGVT